MKSPEDHPPPDTDRVPLTGLMLLFILLAATPIALVLLLSRPDSEIADSPSPTAAAPATAAKPSSTPAPPASPPAAAADDAQHRRSATPRSRPRPSSRLRTPPQPPRQTPPQPSGPQTAGRPDAPTPQPVVEPTCSVTLLSWGTSVHSPWAALGPSDNTVSLPAPLGARYLVLALGVHPAEHAASKLVLVDGPDARADLWLTLPKADSDRRLSPLGRLTEPADRVIPFDTAPLRLGPGAATLEITLAFVVPVRARSAALVVDGTVLQDIPLPRPQPPDTAGFAGTWRKMPGQRLHLRYGDPILNALCSPQHRILSVRRSAENDWLFEFPFTDVTASPARPSPNQPIISLALAHGHDQRDAQARLTDDGNVLMLYLGQYPTERLAYRRAQP